MRQHLTANANMKKRDIMLSNFLGGLSWGFGSVVGATIVVAILLGILRIFNFIPGLGGFTNQISNTVQSRTK